MEHDEVLTAAQRGILERAVYGQMWTIHLIEPKEQLQGKVMDIIKELDDVTTNKIEKTSMICAFNPKLWGKWHDRKIPIKSKILDGGNKWSNTGGDVFIFVKGPDHETVEKVYQTVKDMVAKISDGEPDIVVAGKRPDCKIMGGRYLDSISNPNDPVSMVDDILCPKGPNMGGCFAITQKFMFHWELLSAISANDQDQLLGRSQDNVVLSQHSTLGHIRRAHVYDDNRDQRKMLRQALPYGTSKGHAGREEGIMFVSFCNEQERFELVLKKLVGEIPGEQADRMMDIVQGLGGAYWYVPSAKELGVSGIRGPEDMYEDPHWSVRSENGFMFYNTQDYLHKMAQNQYKGGDPPSKRVLLLMARTFNHWRDGWLRQQHFPRFDHLKDLLKDQGDIFKMPIPIRKGWANKITLDSLTSDPDYGKGPDDGKKFAKKNGLLRIQNKELIVGQIPDFTLGRGKEVVPYMNEEEQMSAWLKGTIDESSQMGHIVPNYDILVQKGLGNMITDLESKRDSAGKDTEKGVFYESCILSLQGVQGWLRNWSKVAERAAYGSDDDIQNMKDVSDRCKRLATEAPKSFHDAVQLIYALHVCLHLVGELTALSRLDQVLIPFFKKDSSLSRPRAQEIIDCFFLKIGENAFLDRSNIYDYRSYGCTTVCGFGGNFPQGGGINQWVQQITVGGYQATDDESPKGGANEVTLMFLKAARRIPCNAPSIGLRVYRGMPDDYIKEAAKTVLSGGAQPTIYNDDKLCEGLFNSGKTVTRAKSRDYAADGCYEPMFQGAAEFTFASTAPLLALEQALNQGATYGAAGPVYLRGMKTTWRSPHPREIRSFEQLQGIFVKQLEWCIVQTYNVILNGYGNLKDVCPSPLLSPFIDGCIEKGKDLVEGGAQYHMISPLCWGMANAIDSLYAIKKLVYDTDTAVTTLPVLLECLILDWGYTMVEPYQNSQTLGAADAAEAGQRFQEFRELALSLPKWGGGSEEVDALGVWLYEQVVNITNDCIRKPHPVLKPKLEAIAEKYGPNFEWIVVPGIGTFEGYVGDGIACGASADGRRAGTAVASDASPVPAPMDLPANPKYFDIYAAMKSLKYDIIEKGVSNAAPCDLNIQENFPLEDLQRFLRAYADGAVGGNMMTITCADVKTYKAATKNPEKYDILRVRMGGWSEFYAIMFPEYQDHAQRRQYFTPTK